jgi:hypothetical protein
MALTPSKTKRSQTVTVSYLETIVDECTRKPPAGAWTLRDLIDRGMNRNTARTRMLQAVADGEIKTAKFKNVLWFWEVEE